MAPEQLANLDGSPLEDLGLDELDGPSDEDLIAIERDGDDRFWMSEDFRIEELDDDDYRDEE